MTRDEHLEWAKQRALEYLAVGDPAQAFTSMLSDLRKHPDTENHVGVSIGVGFMMLPGWINNSIEVRRWIVGFNYSAGLKSAATRRSPHSFSSAANLLTNTAKRKAGLNLSVWNRYSKYERRKVGSIHYDMAAEAYDTMRKVSVASRGRPARYSEWILRGKALRFGKHNSATGR